MGDDGDSWSDDFCCTRGERVGEIVRGRKPFASGGPVRIMLFRSVAPSACLVLRELLRVARGVRGFWAYLEEVKTNDSEEETEG